jgi:hypothetical protein
MSDVAIDISLDVVQLGLMEDLLLNVNGALGLGGSLGTLKKHSLIN